MTTASPLTVTITATLFDGDTDEYKVPHGSTLADLSHTLRFPHAELQVAVDENDHILTPDFVFVCDTNICFVVNTKMG